MAHDAAPLRILMLIPPLGFGGTYGAFQRLASGADVTIAVMDRPRGQRLDRHATAVA